MFTLRVVAMVKCVLFDKRVRKLGRSLQKAPDAMLKICQKWKMFLSSKAKIIVNVRYLQQKKTSKD